jgi:thioredoxin-related protein
MRRLFIILILSIGIIASNCSGGSDAKSEQQKAKTVSTNVTKAEWLGFDKGLAKAKSEKKNMIVDFYTDWCHWCKVMDEKTFSDAEVNKKLVKDFVAVRIDAEDDSKTATYKGKTLTNVELTRAFGVRGFPSLAFIDPEGEVITIIPGYIPAETFSYLLDYIHEACYKKQMSFDEFMKKKGECENGEVKSK